MPAINPGSTRNSLEVTVTNQTVVPGDKIDVRPAGTRNGAAIMQMYADPAVNWSFQGAFTTTSDVVVKTAAGTNLKNYVALIQVTNTGATMNNFIVKDGTTARMNIQVPALTGLVIPIPVCFTVANNAAINAALGTAGTMQANFIGYVGL